MHAHMCINAVCVCQGCAWESVQRWSARRFCDLNRMVGHPPVLGWRFSSRLRCLSGVCILRFLPVQGPAALCLSLTSCSYGAGTVWLGSGFQGGAQTTAPLNLPHACCPRAAWQLCGPGPAASGGTYLPEQGLCIRVGGVVRALCPLQEVSLHLGRVSWLLAKGERGFRVKTLKETETNRDLTTCTARSQDLLLLYETSQWRQDQTAGELPAASCQ